MSHYLIPDWPVPDHVKACTTLRFGGHSQGSHASFNIGKGIDDPDAVLANRRQLIQELGLKQEPLWLNQVHGTYAVQADTVTTPGPKADAAFTSVANVVCTVLTADCLPVLFCNASGTQVAAIHAGWRGLAAGIIEETFNQLQPPAEQWLAWLGPAIGPTKFEVGPEVREQFMLHDLEAQAAFTPQPHDKWLADLFLLATQRLKKCGVTRIYGGEFCTYSDPVRFYSYRRDQGKSGRMASLIWLTK